MTASGMPSPLPSVTEPWTWIASGSSDATAYRESGSARTMWRNGPTVCDGVSGGGSATAAVLEGGAIGAAQDDVEAEAERPLRHRRLVVVVGHHRRSRSLRDRVVHRVLEEQRIVGEVHLRHEALRERATEHGEVDVRRAPGVGVVAPRVGAGADRGEAVAAVA